MDICVFQRMTAATTSLSTVCVAALVASGCNLLSETPFECEPVDSGPGSLVVLTVLTDTVDVSVGEDSVYIEIETTGYFERATIRALKPDSTTDSWESPAPGPYPLVLDQSDPPGTWTLTHVTLQWVASICRGGGLGYAEETAYRDFSQGDLEAVAGGPLTFEVLHTP